MTEELLLEFPCAFRLMVTGVRTDVSAQTVVGIVLRHAPGFHAETVEMHASSKGNYLSVTCVVRAESRRQLDDLYRELSGHPAVKVVL